MSKIFKKIENRRFLSKIDSYLQDFRHISENSRLFLTEIFGNVLPVSKIVSKVLKIVSKITKNCRFLTVESRFLVSVSTVERDRNFLFFSFCKRRSHFAKIHQCSKLLPERTVLVKSDPNPIFLLHSLRLSLIS